MNWSVRYATENGTPDLLDPTRSFSKTRTVVRPDVGNIPGNAVITANGHLYLQNDRKKHWRMHGKDGSIINTRNIRFVHPIHTNNVSDHPVQGWMPWSYDGDENSGTWHIGTDPVAIVLHRCGNVACNYHMSHLVENLRHEHEKLSDQGFPQSDEAWTPAFEAALALTRGLQEHSLQHLANMQASPENTAFVSDEDDNYLTHINTINSIWGQPLSTTSGKIMASPEMYRKLHTPPGVADERD